MKVLLAIDGSKHAHAAEDVLLKFPFSAPPDVHIVTVGPSPDLTALSAVPESVQEMVSQSRKESMEILDAAVTRCQSKCATVTSELLDGHPAQEVLLAADRVQPDLIVVGARGLGLMSRLLIGSVSERVAKHARCSVLVARNHHDSPDVHNVMLAYDHSPGAQAAVQRFAMLPLGSERSVTLHTVVVPQQRYGRERLTLVDEETLTQTAESQLDAAAAMFDHTQCKVRTILHRGADSADDLLDTAAEEDADLIVVGSTGKNAIERFLLGSFSLQVLHHAPCSVWVERGNSPSAEG